MGARFLLLVLLLSACRSTQAVDAAPSPGWTELELVSRVDGTAQPSRIWFPKELAADRPVLLHLHTWSGGWQQESFVPELVEGCADRGWILAMPNFRGPNRVPEACASEQAVGDILDLVEHLEATWQTGPIYVHGASGGGHMGLEAFATPRMSVSVEIGGQGAVHGLGLDGGASVMGGVNFWFGR